MCYVLDFSQKGCALLLLLFLQAADLLSGLLLAKLGGL